MGYYRARQSGFWGPISKSAHAKALETWPTGRDCKEFDAYLTQVALASMGYYRGALDGKAGPRTKRGLSLAADWWARDIASPTPDILPPTASPIGSRIVSAAAGEVGVREVGGNNRGARIDEFESATWIDPKDVEPWCASFVCWVVRQAIQGIQAPGGFQRPRTPGAWDFERWAFANRSAKVQLFKPAQDFRPGDIVVFRFSHIGIVEGVRGDLVSTIEGNTNGQGKREGDQVARRMRKKSTIRSVIRLNF